MVASFALRDISNRNEANSVSIASARSDSPRDRPMTFSQLWLTFSAVMPHLSASWESLL